MADSKESPASSPATPQKGWKSWFGRTSAKQGESTEDEKSRGPPEKWSMGVLNDKSTIEVPGSVLLLAQHRNEPLGLRNQPARTSHSTLPAPVPLPPADSEDAKKKTADGQIILEPQPDDSHNDPLNWPSWRRDCALISLGIYCMIGGGVTPLLAAGFTNVAEDYDIETERVSLTTGIYMLGLGVGCVFVSPTAILYGKRPVYLASAIVFIASGVWCAASPTFVSLLIARLVQGMALSPVEALPSATIAEIFFLHERAFRIGIYSLLLLGGKNLVPLVSAAIIQSLSWRWVFWVLAMVGAVGFVLLFFFVPETFWDRTPHPKPRKPSKRPSFLRRLSSKGNVTRGNTPAATPGLHVTSPTSPDEHIVATPGGTQHLVPKHKNTHVGWAPSADGRPSAHSAGNHADGEPLAPAISHHDRQNKLHIQFGPNNRPEKSDSSRPSTPPTSEPTATQLDAEPASDRAHETSPSQVPKSTDASLPPIASHGSDTPHSAVSPMGQAPPTAHLHDAHSPVLSPFHPQSANGSGYFSPSDSERNVGLASPVTPQVVNNAYTHNLRQQPIQSFGQQLKVWNGRLNKDRWHKVLMRPFILFAYPAVLWSAIVYACSVGWLIVISESVALIYRNKETYNFGAMSTGLVYISPFLGSVLGTAVAGKVSDIIVKAMSRRNGGLYEPEFRLVMAGPVLLTTVVGLMGFGWSAEERDAWIVPTVFFGIVSFGCSLGSTTAITFCVDSYRQYAGEALVTLNFSKNVFHGLVFSLFVTEWLTHDGSKTVFIWLGVIQLILLAFSVPMYIYGKRARMWTVRMNLMEKF